MEELTYIVKRILQMIPVLLIITFIIFFGMRLIPGDPALLLVGNRASDEVIAATRARLGLDEPLFTQYLLFLKQCLTFDFGESMTLRAPVTELFAQKAVITVSLTLMTIGFAILISFPLGYAAGLLWGLDAFWVYLALHIDFAIKAVLCTGRCFTKKWIKVGK